MTYEREMPTHDSTVHKCSHLTGYTAVPVWEGAVIYPRASVRLDKVNHLGSKGQVRHSGCRPELPICPRNR